MGFVLLLFRGVDDRTLLRWAVVQALALILWRLAMLWTSFEPKKPLHDVARAIFSSLGVAGPNGLTGGISTGPDYLEHLKVGLAVRSSAPEPCSRRCVRPECWRCS